LLKYSSPRIDCIIVMRGRQCKLTSKRFLLTVGMFTLLLSLSHVYRTMGETGRSQSPSIPTFSKEETSPGNWKSSVKSLDKNTITRSPNTWCDKVTAARTTVNVQLRIAYPCEGMQPAMSAVVVYVTAGRQGKATRTASTLKQYINGVLAIGASLGQHLTRNDTHKLVLVRDGLTLPPEDTRRLEAVGWTLGTAPNVDIDAKYLPNFERYKTVYTKVSAIGLSEYKCVLLLDADTLVVGSIDDLLGCNMFDRPEYRLAAALDFYHNKWKTFNTGVILYRTGSLEMNRVYALLHNESFMRKFESDQIFLNHVYPDRLHVPRNLRILQNPEKARREWGQVVPFPLAYNAQTHVEVQNPDFWKAHEIHKNVKVIHFTEKKGWQCEEKHAASKHPMPARCNRTLPACFCNEAYRWWDAFRLSQLQAPLTVA